MSFETLHYLNVFLGTGAVVLQAVSVLTLIVLAFNAGNNRYLSFLKENFIVIGFFLSFVPALFSLFYSEVVNFIPCYHCWIQRIFLFPQVFLFTVAWLKKDRGVIWYSLPLLLAGLLDAVYLNYIYYFNPSSAPCDASGISCVQRLVSEFGGYVSIPSLSLTSFVSLLVLLSVAHFYRKGQ